MNGEANAYHEGIPFVQSDSLSASPSYALLILLLSTLYRMKRVSSTSSEGSVDSWNSVTPMENNVSALSTDSPAFALLHEESKRQTALLEHMSKLAEE